MAGKRGRAQVDPELRRQLSSAAASSAEPVEAVLRLRATGRPGTVPQPEATRHLAQTLVTRVAQELGTQAGKYDFNVFANLGYFVLSAPSAFVERILDQPEIASASANRRSG